MSLRRRKAIKAENSWAESTLNKVVCKRRVAPMGLKFTVIFSAIFSAPFSGSGGELSDLPDDIIVSSGVITKVASKPMITKYFSGVTIRMPPAGKAAKLARVFLAQIPPRQRKDIELNYKLLAPSATAAPEIKVKFSKYLALCRGL